MMAACMTRVHRLHVSDELRASRTVQQRYSSDMRSFEKYKATSGCKSAMRRVLDRLAATTTDLQRQAIWETLSGSLLGQPEYEEFRQTWMSAGQLGSLCRVEDDMLNALHNARYDYRNDPEINKLTVYQREDRSRAGTLKRGDPAPNPLVLDLQGRQQRLLDVFSRPGRPLVMICGSMT